MIAYLILFGSVVAALAGVAHVQSQEEDQKRRACEAQPFLTNIITDLANALAPVGKKPLPSVPAESVATLEGLRGEAEEYARITSTQPTGC